MRAGCKDKLPSKMKKDKNCKKLKKITCKKLKSKCKKKLGNAIGKSKNAKKCKSNLTGNSKVRVHVFCKLSCKKCGN